MKLSVLAALAEAEAPEHGPLPVDGGIYDPAGEFREPEANGGSV